MSRIQVHVYADLRQYLGGAASTEVDAQPGQTVAAVMQQLGIPAERTRIVFVNHRAAGLEQPLAGGDRVDLFSAIGGG
jgi:molybdopterin converting factor small subunit